MYETLEDIFEAVAVKYLKAVDVKRGNNNKKGSNQHEIGGLVKAGFGRKLGFPIDGKTLKFAAKMVYISDDESEPIVCEDTVSWYDTRYKDPLRGAEYRLYYHDNEVTQSFREDDFLLIALTKEQTLLLVFAPKGSSAEVQLKSIFGALNLDIDTALINVPVKEASLVIPVRIVLAQLGIDVSTSKVDDESKLTELLNRFDSNFPKTRVFSEYSRKLVQSEVCAVEAPDQTLLAWMEAEEQNFRLLERHIVSEQLKLGFGGSGHDVDAFIKFSLSVQNRRKSRVGHAFENHIEAIFIANNLSYKRGGKTEGKQTPDFLFPSQKAYQNKRFDERKLRMLGAKTSCKDRWRQVLAEAKRIETKHLLTLEPAISEEQTTQMVHLKLQLVVPKPLHETYTPNQLGYLQTFKSFIDEVQAISG
ncbi:type II restriction endonuclease [Shewanella waksmanii]|uniref:type II restriction endonuclease n=1 Tax=Shewanella waksmanii TaxID=213783 RepID=UPI00048F1810|nr:type II restriction endonuclease [Shewanella waksmanii]